MLQTVTLRKNKSIDVNVYRKSIPPPNKAAERIKQICCTILSDYHNLLTSAENHTFQATQKTLISPCDSTSHCKVATPEFPLHMDTLVQFLSNGPMQNNI